jgi:hypothetical protein
MKPKTGPYDPGWVVELAKEQRPADAELVQGLARCTMMVGECDCGCGDPCFVNPASRDWKVKRCVELMRADGVSVIVDVLEDGRVGSIEIGEWWRKK